MRQLFTGDTWCDPITLKKKNSGPVDLTGAVIKAAVVDIESNIILETITVSAAEAGSDWANGIIIPVFNSTLTSTVPVGNYYFEIQVDLNSKKQTYPRTTLQFQVIKGVIS